jgi:hypothetical protein
MPLLMMTFSERVSALLFLVRKGSLRTTITPIERCHSAGWMVVLNESSERMLPS